MVSTTFRRRRCRASRLETCFSAQPKARPHSRRPGPNAQPLTADSRRLPRRSRPERNTRTKRPLPRPCPPSRPRSPANARRLVGLLTHGAGPAVCLLADCFAHRRRRPQWHRYRRPWRPPRGFFETRGRRSPPVHSGGAVPELHRSSLFAARLKISPPGHQRRGGSVAVGATMSTMAGILRTTVTVFHDELMTASAMHRVCGACR
jgi:hypothetical protein